MAVNNVSLIEAYDFKAGVSPITATWKTLRDSKIQGEECMPIRTEFPFSHLYTHLLQPQFDPKNIAKMLHF